MATLCRMYASRASSVSGAGTQAAAWSFLEAGEPMGDSAAGNPDGRGVLTDACIPCATKVNLTDINGSGEIGFLARTSSLKKTGDMQACGQRVKMPEGSSFCRQAASEWSFALLRPGAPTWADYDLGWMRLCILTPARYSSDPGWSSLVIHTVHRLAVK